MARWPWKSRPSSTEFRTAAALLLATAAGPQAVIAQPERLGDFSSYGIDQGQQGRPQTGLKVIPLTLHRAGGPTTYRVEVAATPGQQATGMMFRRSMAPGTGMLFPMQPAREASFWMRNTLIPLDLVFIAPDRRVLGITANARPQSDDPLPSGGKVIAVLELAGGEARRIGLRPGDRVDW